MAETGLVLAGGAARGAYQAGVLRFLYCDLAPRIGRPLWADVVSGTSVGALNGVFAASRTRSGIEQLQKIWQNLTIEQVYRFGLRDLWRLSRAVFRGNDAFGLLDGQPFHQLIEREFPTSDLRRALDSGATRAFIVSATQLSTGRNLLYVDGETPADAFGSLPHAMVSHTRIRPHHCVASASIPFLFRPVQVGGTWLVDGGLRMNTPLRPVLRTGVDRVLVVSLMQNPAGSSMEAVPNLSLLAGKTFNALLLDPVERDLEATRRMNALIAWGEERFGPSFTLGASDALGLHDVRTLFVRPRIDIGSMASEVYDSQKVKAARPIRYFLDRIHAQDYAGEADLLSYLLFDRVFTGALEALGFEDARRNEEALAAFLTREDAPDEPR